MNALIRWSIRYRGIVTLLSVVWLVAGIAIAMRAPLDVFPEFVPPQVTIQTEAPGLAPEQVEQMVTRPIEAAVNGAPGVEQMRSESVYGLSVILITFGEEVDPVIARQGVSERLATLTGRLPVGVAQPKLTPLTSSTMDVIKIGLVSDAVDPYTLRDLADWTLKPRLLAVPGIARVTVYGGAIRQVQIQPKLERLTALGLTIADVMKAGREALALRGGGFVETAAQRITLETPPPAPDPRAIAETLVVMRNNAPIKLGDVATVTIAPAVQVGDATIMGRPGVLLTVSGQFGANTLEATTAIEAALAEVTPSLIERDIEIYPALHRPATFVERALHNLEAALALGSAFILIVLYAFLRSVRAALISFLAIPLSLLAAVAVVTELGQSINTMTLGGFALALGVLVDDAIIDIENIMRRLRQARAAGNSNRACRHRKRVDRDPRLDALWDARGHLRVSPRALRRRRARPLHRPDGAHLHDRRPRLDGGRADGDARPLRASAHGRRGDGGAAPSSPPEAGPGLGAGESPQDLGLDGRDPCRGCRRRGRRRAVPQERAHPAIPRGPLRGADVDGSRRDIGCGSRRDRRADQCRAPAIAVHRYRRAPDRPRGGRRGYMEP